MTKWFLEHLAEGQCGELFRQYRWPTGVICPSCGSHDVGRLYDVRDKEVSQYRCATCQRTFSDVSETVFETSHATLPEWVGCLHVLHLKCSTHEIADELEISYKMADNMVKAVARGLKKPRRMPCR